jgi:hypothetical protein
VKTAAETMLNKKRRALLHDHLKYGKPPLRYIAKELNLGAVQNVYPLIREYAQELVNN